MIPCMQHFPFPLNMAEFTFKYMHMAMYQNAPCYQRECASFNSSYQEKPVPTFDCQFDQHTQIKTLPYLLPAK